MAHTFFGVLWSLYQHPKQSTTQNLYQLLLLLLLKVKVGEERGLGFRV